MLPGTLDVMMSHVEQQVVAFANLVEQPDVPTHPRVPELGAGPSSGSQTRMPGILRQQTEVGIDLTTLLRPEAAIGLKEPLAPLQLHRTA